jgi:hypothetical protein
MTVERLAALLRNMPANAEVRMATPVAEYALDEPVDMSSDGGALIYVPVALIGELGAEARALLRHADEDKGWRQVR